MTGCSPTRSADVANLCGIGIIPLGQAIAHSGAQLAAQQSISSWSGMADPAIGQSGAGMAKAAPEANARESASQSKAISRRMGCKVEQDVLAGN